MMQPLPTPPKSGVQAPAAQAKKKTYFLLDSDKQIYGDRCPRGFEKLDLLGK